ncbi:MAG: hypothetical protein KGI58_03870 [Patescibacteria group bacterium]|nr:hypothetical protein [Patescibacteria group bacterium]
MRDILRDKKYNPANHIPFAFSEGESVIKNTGDYTFDGIVLSVFRNRSGSPRYVVENEQGIIHIFNHNQLKSKEK